MITNLTPLQAEQEVKRLAALGTPAKGRVDQGDGLLTIYEQGDNWTPPTPSASELAAEQLQVAGMELANEVQRVLNLEAAKLGFGTEQTEPIVSARTYAGFTNSFQADALRLSNWSAACWVVFETRKAAVLAGTATMPTKEELLAMLPAFN